MEARDRDSVDAPSPAAGRSTDPEHSRQCDEAPGSPPDRGARPGGSRRGGARSRPASAQRPGAPHGPVPDAGRAHASRGRPSASRVENRRAAVPLRESQAVASRSAFPGVRPALARFRGVWRRRRVVVLCGRSWRQAPHHRVRAEPSQARSVRGVRMIRKAGRHGGDTTATGLAVVLPHRPVDPPRSAVVAQVDQPVDRAHEQRPAHDVAERDRHEVAHEPRHVDAA